MNLPTGTVTLLFTDIEGSTQLLQRLGSGYPAVLEQHQALLRAAFESHHGCEVDTQGDAFFIVFARAHDALAAAIEAQKSLHRHAWPEGSPVRVRMALHTGEPERSGNGYAGLDLHRAARLMGAGHGRQVLLSQSTCDMVESDLPAGLTLRDLGRHRLKDLSRPEHIHQLLIEGVPGDFPPLRSIDNRPHNLPSQPTPLLGRETEAAQACALLRRDDVHLLTLLGCGGTGKTRLSQQVGAELLADFEDGVFFVALAPISDAELVLPAIAQVLSLRPIGGQPMLQTLQEHLRERPLLLVLDNLEQVAAVAPRISELLTACPRLKVLATSRVALHVRGEHELPVPPLALPDRQPPPPFETLSQYAAVALFIARARAVRAGFEVTSDNAPAVAEICVRLDGLPLALELAAARIKLLSPQAMLTRLQSHPSLQLLTGGARDLDLRQQTLRAAIAWSYDLLDPDEKKLFARLGVFVGGCTLEAAEGVCSDGLTLDIFDGVCSLVDKSLLRQEENEEGEARFVMLETIREFAVEKQLESGEADEMDRRHAEYFVGLVDAVNRRHFAIRFVETVPFSAVSDFARMRKRFLRVESGNLRTVMEWTLAHDAALAIPLADGEYLTTWVETVGLEALPWLRRLLQRDLPLEVRAKVLLDAGQQASWSCEPLLCCDLLEEAVALYRGFQDLRGLTRALYELGGARIATGQLSLARSLLEEALSAAPPGSPQRGDVLHSMAQLLMVQGEFASALPLLQETDRLSRNESWNSLSMGFCHYKLGDLERARGLAEQFIAEEKARGSLFHYRPFWVLAQVSRAEGDADEAARCLQRSLECVKHQSAGSGVTKPLQWTLALIMEIHALLAADSADWKRATQLLGAAEHLREQSGNPLYPYEITDQEPVKACAREALGVASFEAEWRAGRAMPWQEMIDYALAR